MNENIEQINHKDKFSIYKWFKEFDVPKYLAFVGLFLFSLSLFFTTYDFVRYAKDFNTASKIWFGILDRFTNQSNILLLVFVIFYLFFPKHSFMKNNGFLISCMVFIFFTFFGYNVILVGLSGYGYDLDDGIIPLLGNICMHLLFPIYFIVFGLIHMYFKPMQEPRKFWKLLLLGMIYPTIYVIYIIIIPFVYSGYKVFSEMDKQWYPSTYTVYGDATNVKDKPISWAYILVMYLGFFPGSFAIFYYSWKGFNKLNKKQNKI